MNRIVQSLLALALVLLVVAIAIYGVRTWKSRAATRAGSVAQPSMADMNTTGPPAGGAGPTTTPRGDVAVDPRRQQLIGVRTVPVTRATLAETVRAVGVVRYDETRLADVNLKIEGWIRDLYVDYTGQLVQKGQPLFTLYSPDLLTTENEYLLALKTREQFQRSTIADARERADQLVAAARQRLAFWDLPADDIRALEDQRQPVEAVVFRSPVTGFVIEKQAVKGLHVTAGQSLYKVADLSMVWVEADVYENEVSSVRTGAVASVAVDAYPGERFSGRVIYVYPYLDDKTRTNKVRFEFANRRGRLKPGMYANVDLPIGGGTGLTVPTDALLDSGTEQIVFVAKGDGMFEPRRVTVGRRLRDAVQILDGLKEGDIVATGATFFLDSESQLRASLQGYESPPATRAGPAGTGVDITFRTIPGPPKSGDNQVEVTVKDASGKPIDDAEVTVQFFMPAMPTMNMPAMRNEVKLSPAGGGVYRGTGQVPMAGRWDATIIATRAGKHLGTKQLPVVVK